ncbi:MAG: CDP-2,3-bis-(O-geranylgeranyl)-sn-glycerol synthase [Candidatus Aenigmatarchaeota archaeon]|nr:MAG: CDP-2,3-bis-(O-geranylgeranyl)-sn-glycerol synthase [Candidatus Aenigmarchaeota archaeon]
MLEIIINSFWLIIPAYCANFFPVLLKGKHPIDFGKKFIDGFRLFGDGKTIEGFFGGIFFGIFIGLLLIYLQPFIQQFYTLQFQHNLLTVFLLTTGAISGDIIGSFVKRRFGIERGEPAPLLDQLDFLVFSLVLVSIVRNLNLYFVVFLVIITPIIHYSANLCAFLLKLKDRI